MMTEARRKGVNGVPFVVIDGKWAVSGGQTAEVYTQVSLVCVARVWRRLISAQIFKKLAANEQAASTPRPPPPPPPPSANVPVAA